MRRLPLAITQLVERPASERCIGPFVLLHQLGHGGFAPVWAARETYGDTNVRDAAVKLFALGRQSTYARDRVVREVQALCRVDHPHIVRFYSLVLDEPAEVGALAMELVAGRSLGSRVADAGPLATTDVLRIGTAVASALSEVHRAGLLHRDVKPDNIVEAEGTIKLIDFGIAIPSDDDDDDTRTDDPGQTAKIVQRVTGTPGFVAPEYLRGESPSIAGELYALGATLHTCVTGFPPAARTNEIPCKLDPDILERRRPPAPLGPRAPHIPLPLVELIERLISPDPHDRPASAAWVAERLLAITRDFSRRRELPPEDIGPFRGLGRFDAADRDIFFGRDGEIGSVLELLRQRSFVVLVGPSGCGKSSLARAGILPRVTEGALERWPNAWDTAIVAPGPDPAATMMEAISTWIGASVTADVNAVVEALEKNVERSGKGLVLFIDPLEELVTLERESTADSRRFFIDLLVRLGDAAPEGVKVLAAARRDLLDSLLALPSVGKTLARSFVLVEPLHADSLRDVLRQALDAYGYTLEDEVLLDELFEGVEQSADAMPLVAFALTEAWRTRDTAGKRLTRAGLWAIGGLRGALERHAEVTLDEFVGGHTEKLDAARRMLLALTTLDGTRAAKTLDKLRLLGGEHAETFVKTFVAARLCVPVERGGATLAHEALIGQWGRLAAWMSEAREARCGVAELERAARFWRTDPDVAPLIRGAKLERIQKHVRAADGEWLSEDAQGYLRESLARARKEQRLVRGGAILVSLGVFGGVLAYGRMARDRAPRRAEQVLLAEGREMPTAPVASAEQIENEPDVNKKATPPQQEVLPTMAASTTEPNKKAGVRNAVSRTSASTSMIVPMVVSSAEPAVSAEVRPMVTALPRTTSSATEPKQKRKSRFVLEDP